MKKQKLIMSVFRLTKEQIKWLDKEAKHWGSSKSQVVRSLINAKFKHN